MPQNRQDGSPITQAIVAADLAALQDEIVTTQNYLLDLQRLEKALLLKMNAFSEEAVSDARKKGKGKVNIAELTARYGSG